MQREKNIEEVAILYSYNILKDTIERKCFKNCPLNLSELLCEGLIKNEISRKYMTYLLNDSTFS